MHLGGEGRIRTHGPVNGAPVFKTGAFDRSATSPYCLNNNYNLNLIIATRLRSSLGKLFFISWLTSVRNFLASLYTGQLRNLKVIIKSYCYRYCHDRRGGDSNPRAGKTPTYRFSKPAPSASWVPLQTCLLSLILA